MFRFYNTTKTRGAETRATAPPQKAWRTWIVTTFLLGLLPFIGNAQVTNTTTSTAYADLASAITAATNGDVLQLTADLTLSTQTTINKELTIDGNNHIVTVTGSSHIFFFSPNNSDGSTLENMTINKTDATNQSIILVQDNNLTFDNIDFTGTYNLGDAQVSRAFEVVGGLTGLTIENCSFSHLRQPGYINAGTSGQINNNYVDNTKGWVIVANAPFTFNGNTWGTNAADISFIQDSPPVTSVYSPTDMANISAANDNAIITNELTRVTNVSTGANYPDLASAVAAATSGNTLRLNTNLNISSTVNIDKPLTIDGNNDTIFVTGNTYTLKFLSTSAGTTVKDVSIIKTDDNVAQNFIFMQAANLTFDHIAFSGQFNIGDSETTRAFTGSSSTGLLIENCSFNNIRQPGYLDPPMQGSITNCYVNNTKGWVILGNTSMTFNGNTWGTNVLDISIIGNPTLTHNNYNDSVLAQIKADNNNPSIKNMLNIEADGTLATFASLYGHTSASQSFTIAADGPKSFLTNQFSVYAANGFEVSSDDVTFGSTALVDTNAGTPIYVRFNAANQAVASSPYADNILVYIAGVDTQAVAANATVSQDTLTIDASGVTVNSKVYNGNTDASVTGAFAFTTTPASVTLDVTNATYTYDNKNVGTGKTVTVTGFALAGTNAANYFLADTPVVFTTGVITKKAATITAANQTKCYNVAFTGVADSVHFTDTGFVAGEGVATVDLTSTGSGSLASAGNYPIVPSNAVGDSATDVSNYNITYVNGVLKALPKLAVYINTVANQSVCAGNSISLNYTLEGPGVLSADLLISKVDGLVTPFDTFHIDNKIAGSSQSVTIPDSLTPNTGNTDVKYRLTWINVTSDSINCDGITNGQVDVTINPAPALAVTYTDTTICSGNDWTLGLSNPNAVTGATYKIVANYGAATGNIPAAGVTNNFGVSSYTDHLVNNSNAPVVVTYTITTKSPSPNNCDGAFEIVTITVNPNPVLATVVADSVCEGTMTTITLNGLNPNMDYDIEGTISGNFDNNGTSGTFSFPGLTGSFTADASGMYSFSYPTVYGDSVVTDYAAQVTKLTYSTTGCSIDYTDSNKIGNGVVHPLPNDYLQIASTRMANNASTSVCEGSVVTVSTHGDSANTYTLYRGDHSSVVATGNVGDSTYSFTARLSDDGQYFLHVESPFGCSTEDTIALGVNPLPVATLMADGSALNNGDTLVVCEATPVTLELTGTLSTDSYVLLQGTDTTAAGHVNDAAFTFPAGLSDAGTYYLHVMNSDGCGVVDTFNLTVNPLPTDVFAINGTTVGTVNVQSGDTVNACATSPMTFTVTGNAADSFVLYRGSTLVYNGHPGAPAHSFSAATINSGTYYLTMMNAHGCVVADTFVLKVNPLPQAAFVVNGFAAHNDDSLAYCEGTPMALTLTGTATDSYVLLHGTDTVGAGHPNGPTYNFTAALSDAGTYYLYLNNSFGCGTVDTYNLAIHPLPTDVFTVNGTAVDNGDTVTFCENSPVTLTLTGNSADSFALYHGTTLVGAGMSNGPAYNFNASASYDAGTYYMHLISEHGCETVDTIEMVVNPLPTATLTFNANPLMNGDTAMACVESPVILELTGDSTDSYVLLHGTDTVAAGHPNDPAFPFNAAMSDAGTYYLHLSSVHGCGIVDTFNLNVVAKPAFAWSFNGFPATANDSATAINYCASDTLALGLNIDSNYTFTIALDGSMAPAMPGVDTTVAVPMSFVTPGIHSIQLTVTNQNGCDSSMTVFINVHGLPTFAANTITNVHCHGGTDGSFGFVVLNNDSTTANYTFNIINVNGNDTVYTLNVNSLAPTSPIIVAGTQSNLGAGTYQVVVSNSFGCATVDTVVISEPPALSLAMTSQDVTCGAVTPNGKIQVQPTGGVPIMGMYELTVSGPGYNNAQYAAPGGSVYTINNLGAGVYTLTLADSNGCSITQTDTITKPSANVVTSVNGPDTVNMNASASVILSATGAALPVTYTYTVNGGTPQTATSSASSADVTLTVPTNTVGTVAYAITAVTDANGAPCSPVLGSGTVEVVSVSRPDLAPVVQIVGGSLNSQHTSANVTITIYNIGNDPTSGSFFVYISKPTASVSLSLNNTPDWTVTQVGNFYKLEYIGSAISGNNGNVVLSGSLVLANGAVQGGSFPMSTIISGVANEVNTANNSNNKVINVSQ